MSITLVFDQGNSTLGVSAFSQGKPLFLERIDYRQPSLMEPLKELLEKRNIPIREIAKVIMGSVVPSQSGPVFQEMRSGFPALAVLLDSSQIARELETCQFPPHLGIDRMANGLAAWESYRQGCCVIDFGTATTFTVIGPNGVFAGGAIAPGLKSSMDCLTSRGEQLGKLPQDWAEMVPDNVLQKSTGDALSTGVLYSYIGGIESLIGRIKKELPFEPLLIGTGGIAQVVRTYLPVVEKWDEFLTLEGFYRMGGMDHQP